MEKTIANIAIAMSILFLLSIAAYKIRFNTYCKIEQDISIDSYCNDTRHVRTEVWVFNWFGTPLSIETMENDYNITINQLDSVKTVRMQEAIIIKTKVDNCIQNSR